MNSLFKEVMVKTRANEIRIKHVPNPVPCSRLDILVHFGVVLLKASVIKMLHMIMDISVQVSSAGFSNLPSRSKLID